MYRQELRQQYLPQNYNIESYMEMLIEEAEKLYKKLERS
jgi:hypothetical protein